MKLGFLCIVVFVFASLTYSQSGRRAKTTASPTPLAVEEVKPAPNTERPDRPPVSAEKNQDYRCTDDGSLVRILETVETHELILSAKEADEPVLMTKKPSPDYTREARRNGIQGFVTLRVLLAADSEVSRVRVLKGLPAGLTENAIRAACKIQFKPATKAGRPVATWVTVEFAFRLADSSIFRP